MPPRLGIRAALVLLVLILIGPVLALLIFTSFSEQDSALEKARGRARIEAQLRASAQQQLFEGVRHLLIVVGHSPAILEPYSQPCSAYLRDLQEHFPQYAHLGFAHANGNLLCRSAPGSDPVYVGDRQYFKNAISSGRFTVGEYLVSRVLKKPAIALSIPVYTKTQELHGVLYGVLDLEGLQKQFVSAPMAPGMTDVIMDANGVVLASAGEHIHKAGAPLPEQFRVPLPQGPHATQSEGDGKEWVVALRSTDPVGGGAWVASFVSKENILRPAVERLRNQLLILLAITLAALLLAWYMGDRLLVGPIERMLQKVKSIERGETRTSQPSATTRVRELAQIDNGIDELVTTLAARSAQRDQAMADLQAQAQNLAASERRYRAQFDASPQPMWAFDIETLAFLVVNDAAVAHYGYSREEFMRMTLANIRPSEDVPLLLEGLSNIRQKEVAAERVLRRHRRKDGEIINVEVASHALDWNGRPARVAIAYDVTSRELAKKSWAQLHATLEQQVAQRTRELELANHELEAFSYSVSHDLRAPLQAIDGFSGALAQKYGNQLPAQANHYLQRIRAGAVHMNAVIDDLLSLSRTARAVVQRKPISLASVARATVDRLRQQHPDRHVNVVIEESLTADCDAGLVAVLFDNLIGNAWKFTSRTPDAEIRVGSVASADEGAIFFVSDNGAGFDMAHAVKLFKPFERLHTVSEFEGTGIGLAIVQRIVQRHGGRVWAESESGRGAQFFFTLQQRAGETAV